MSNALPQIAALATLCLCGCVTPQPTKPTSQFASDADVRAVHLRMDLSEYLARQESRPGVLRDVRWDSARGAVVAEIETDQMQLTDWPITRARYAQARNLQPPLKPAPGQEDPYAQAKLLADTMAVFFDHRFGDRQPQPTWVVVFRDEPLREPFATVTNGELAIVESR